MVIAFVLMDQKCCSSPSHCVCIPVGRKEERGRRIRVYSLPLRMSTVLAHTTFYTLLTRLSWLQERMVNVVFSHMLSLKRGWREDPLPQNMGKKGY